MLRYQANFCSIRAMAAFASGPVAFSSRRTAAVRCGSAFCVATVLVPAVLVPAVFVTYLLSQTRPTPRPAVGRLRPAAPSPDTESAGPVTSPHGKEPTPRDARPDGRGGV